MEIRKYLEVLRRQRAVIIEAALIIGLLAWLFSSLRTPIYEATARVLIEPNDPSETIDSTTANQASIQNPDRTVSAQLQIIQSIPVAQQAAKAIPGSTAQDLLSEITAQQVGSSDVISISATDPDATRARDVANAFASGYIENRRLDAVSGLQRAADDVGTRLKDVQTSIAKLDQQINALPATPGATSTPTNPTPPVTFPGDTGVAPPGQSAALTDTGGQPTTDESLKAARYAAALQYQTLYARQQQLLIDISLKRGNAELIGVARAPLSPVRPKPIRDGVLGACVGLLFGVGIGLLREQLNDKMHSNEEITRATGLSVIGELPFLEGTDGIATVSASRSVFSEAVRSLRTSIDFLGIDEPIRLLVVTSPSPGDGKSTVSSNLSAVYAQAGYRTLLVSADLRKPRLYQVFGYDRDRKGLSDLIAQVEPRRRLAARAAGPGSQPVSEHEVTKLLVEGPVPNLFVLPAGSLPPNPAELLGSQRAVEVLEQLLTMFDLVVLDTPPLLPVTDAAVLASRADGVLLVAAEGETRRSVAQRASGILTTSRARCLGVVLNKAPTGGRGSYYYAAYYGDDDEPESRRERRRAKSEQKKAEEAAAKADAKANKAKAKAQKAEAKTNKADANGASSRMGRREDEPQMPAAAASAKTSEPEPSAVIDITPNSSSVAPIMTGPSTTPANGYSPTTAPIAVAPSYAHQTSAPPVDGKHRPDTPGHLPVREIHSPAHRAKNGNANGKTTKSNGNGKSKSNKASSSPARSRFRFRGARPKH